MNLFLGDASSAEVLATYKIKLDTFQALQAKMKAYADQGFIVKRDLYGNQLPSENATFDADSAATQAAQRDFYAYCATNSIVPFRANTQAVSEVTAKMVSAGKSPIFADPIAAENFAKYGTPKKPVSPIVWIAAAGLGAWALLA